VSTDGLHNGSAFVIHHAAGPCGSLPDSRDAKRTVRGPDLYSEKWLLRAGWLRHVVIGPLRGIPRREDSMLVVEGIQSVIHVLTGPYAAPACGRSAQYLFSYDSLALSGPRQECIRHLAGSATLPSPFTGSRLFWFHPDNSGASAGSIGIRGSDQRVFRALPALRALQWLAVLNACAYDKDAPTNRRLSLRGL